MDNIVKISNILEQKVFDNSLSFFWSVKENYGVRPKVTTKEYKNLLHGIYQIHEMKEKTYLYEEDIKKYLEIAFLNSLEDSSYIITKENIIDAIFDIETKSEQEINSKRKILLKNRHY
jgi:hypothetical protein